MWDGALLSLIGLLLQAGPPPLPIDELQVAYGILAVLLAVRMVIAPIIYLDARRKSNRESWWAIAALCSPLIAGIAYLVMRAPKDGPGPSAWNPWVQCPQCGAPRGWSPDPCLRCGNVLPVPAATPIPGFPLPPPGYVPTMPVPSAPMPWAPPLPGVNPMPAPPRKKSRSVSVPQVLGALIFAIILTNVVATLVTLPAIASGISQAELIALSASPTFILLALLLQDSILLAITLDQALFQGRLTRETMGLRWSASGKGLPWHLAVGVGAGLLTFTFSALFLDGLVRLLQPLGFELADEAASGGMRPGALSDYLVLLPAVVIIAPVAEEFFFRGYALGGLAQKGYVNQGVLVTSVLFAAIHLNPFTFLPLVAAGLVLAGVFLRTGSLVAPIVAHATNNFVALTLAFYGF